MILKKKREKQLFFLQREVTIKKKRYLTGNV